MIQGTEECSRSCSSTTVADDRKDCKDPEYRIGLIFDGSEPAQYTWFDFDSEANDIESYIREYEASAFTLDMVGGMRYLNDGYDGLVLGIRSRLL